MTSLPIEGAKRLGFAAPKAPGSDIPLGLRVIGSVLRLVFIASLLAITVRVALPQSETIWTVYDTPGDLVRRRWPWSLCLGRGAALLGAQRQKRLSDLGLFRARGDAVRPDFPGRDLVTF